MLLTHKHTKNLTDKVGESHEMDNLANIPLFPSSASLLAVVSRSSLLWGDEQRVTMMDDVEKGGGQDTRGRREHNQERVNHAWRFAPQILVRILWDPTRWSESRVAQSCQGILRR